MWYYKFITWPTNARSSWFSLSVLALFLLFAKPCPGQAVSASDSHNHRVLAGEIISPVIRYAGSPYLFEQWSSGEVILRSGAVIQVERIRYDGLSDVLLWLTPDDNSHVAIDKGLIRGFHMQHPLRDGVLVFYMNVMLEEPPLDCEQCFVQLLETGTFSLYAQRSIRITSRTENVVFGGESHQMRVLANDFTFYLLTPDGNTFRIRPDRRSLSGVFSDYPRETRQAVRRISRQVRSESDLIHAVSELNALYASSPALFD